MIFVCSLRVAVMSPPHLIVLPPYAKSVAQAMADTTTLIPRGKCRCIVRHPLVDDEA